MRLIPLTADNAQRLTIELGGTQFTITVIWNVLADGWYASIARGTTNLTDGRRMTLGAVLVNHDQYGLFTVVASRGAEGDPGRLAWNMTHNFVWLTPAEAAMIDEFP